MFYMTCFWCVSDGTADRGGRCRVSVPLRPVAAPFVAAAPAGARVRTRLRVSAQDEAVLLAAGRHLGSLAGPDLESRTWTSLMPANKDASATTVGPRAAVAAGAIVR